MWLCKRGRVSTRLREIKPRKACYNVSCAPGMCGYTQLTIVHIPVYNLTTVGRGTDSQITGTCMRVLRCWRV